MAPGLQSNSIFRTFAMSSAVRLPCSVPYVSTKETVAWRRQSSMKAAPSTVCSASSSPQSCHLSPDVSGRPVHFGGILAREGTTTLSAPTAVYVDDALSSRQTGAYLRTTNGKFTSWPFTQSHTFKHQVPSGLKRKKN